MTMKEEIEQLRKEVEQLRKEKEAAELAKARAEEETAEKQEAFVDEAVEEVKKLKGEFGDSFKEIAEQVKKDYENLSPATAVLLFALGALFGRSLSK